VFSGVFTAEAMIELPKKFGPYCVPIRLDVTNDDSVEEVSGIRCAALREYKRFAWAAENGDDGVAASDSRALCLYALREWAWGGQAAAVITAHLAGIGIDTLDGLVNNAGILVTPGFVDGAHVIAIL
jgi:NAD(P)-dependent dehydrogenase (short-subunit alcohol dehydrogenase family)